MFRLNRFFLIVFLSIGFSAVFGQKTVSKIQSEILSLKKDIAYTDSLIKVNSNNVSQLSFVIKLLDAKIDKQNQLVSSIVLEINRLDKIERGYTKNINTLKKDIENLKIEYAKLIKYSYRNRDKYQMLMFVFASSDFDQAYKRIKYIQNISEYQRNKVTEVKSKQNDYIRLRKDLKSLKAQKKSVLLEQKTQLANISKDKIKQEELIKEASLNIKSLQQTLNNQLKREKELTDVLNKLIEDERIAALERARSKVISEEDINLAKYFKKNKGKLPWPGRECVLVSNFGVHNHFLIKSVMVKEDGIKISIPKDGDVLAIFDGVVTKVMYMPGSNMTTLIKHGDYFSVYNNVINVTVNPGDKVTTRQKIGTIYSGNGDNSNILGFRINEEGSWVNPIIWLRKKK